MSNEVAILGVGMHPWGKWGRNFVEYGVHAIKAALSDAGLDWKQVEFVAGGDTVRNGYPGYVSGATFAKAMGWTGIPVSSSYAACATGAQAMEVARTRILAGMCEVAVVVGADPSVAESLATNLLDIMEKQNLERGVTFLFSTHDPRVMERARRIVRVVDGRVERDERGP